MSNKEKFEQLFNNELSTNDARDFLVELYNKGESSTDIANAASVMREHSIKVDLSEELLDKAIDIVGTGGDKSGSFNISTTVSLLLASLGAVVAKHGNRSITSNSGSTDVLEALGINLDLSRESKVKMLESVGFCFFPATDHHPAMKHIMPIRKSIEHRTIFNILGPLTNPAGAKKYLLGVFDPSFIGKIAEALVELKAKRAYVVSSQDGMDEIGISSKTSYAFIENGVIATGDIDPRDYGFKLASKEDILGGDATFNAAITKDIFNGKIGGAKLDIVLLNAAFALHANAMVDSIEDGINMAQKAIDTKQAINHLRKISDLSVTLK